MMIVIDTEIIDCLEYNGGIYNANLVLKCLTCTSQTLSYQTLIQVKYFNTKLAL